MKNHLILVTNNIPHFEPDRVLKSAAATTSVLFS